jgi:hypothetical protein
MKLVLVCFLSAFLFFPSHAAFAKALNSDGTIDNQSGLENKDLVYRDFEITPGFITGSIVNISNHALNSVKLNIWTTNKPETQILWRSSVVINSLPPNGKYEVKMPYSPMPDDPASVVFKFRVVK